MQDLKSIFDQTNQIITGSRIYELHFIMRDHISPVSNEAQMEIQNIFHKSLS